MCLDLVRFENTSLKVRARGNFVVAWKEFVLFSLKGKLQLHSPFNPERKGGRVRGAGLITSSRRSATLTRYELVYGRVNRGFHAWTKRRKEGNIFYKNSIVLRIEIPVTSVVGYGVMKWSSSMFCFQDVCCTRYLLSDRQWKIAERRARKSGLIGRGITVEEPPIELSFGSSLKRAELGYLGFAFK